MAIVGRTYIDSFIGAQVHCAGDIAPMHLFQWYVADYWICENGVNFSLSLYAKLLERVFFCVFN